MNDIDTLVQNYRSIQLRPACILDARILLEWRNDEASRLASPDPRHITAEEHFAWLVRAIRHSHCAVFIAERNGVPVGSTRRKVRELSWVVKPTARGKGVATSMVLHTINLTPEVASLCATIHRDNVASRRVAEKCGFTLTVPSASGFDIWECTT